MLLRIDRLAVLRSICLGVACSALLVKSSRLVALSEIVQEVYGPGAEQSSGSGPSEAVQQALDVGQPLPEGANAQPVEMKLASRLPAGPEWLAVGENLVAVDADGRVSRVYHDMLP